MAALPFTKSLSLVFHAVCMNARGHSWVPYSACAVRKNQLGERGRLAGNKRQQGAVSMKPRLTWGDWAWVASITAP